MVIKLLISSNIRKNVRDKILSNNLNINLNHLNYIIDYYIINQENFINYNW